MVGVRVPFLNPSIWRYALEDAAEGAMIWRDERDHIAAFNMVHRSGTEGWMGPLAVRTEYQGSGVGKEIVQRGVEWLKTQRASVIGLETMPRTMDNIGFYSRLGFLPGRLTITMTLDAQQSIDGARLFGRLSTRARDDALTECRDLVQRLIPGYDYSREITLTSDLSVGDTVLLYDGDRLVGFALAHTAPLVEGRAREELRVLKLALDDESRLEDLLRAVSDLARRSGCVAFRFAFRESSVRRTGAWSRSARTCAGRICACRSLRSRNDALSGGSCCPTGRSDLPLGVFVSDPPG